MDYDFAEFNYSIGEVKKAIDPMTFKDRVPGWVVPMAASLMQLLEGIEYMPEHVRGAVESLNWYYTADQAAADLRMVIEVAQSGTAPAHFELLRHYLEMLRTEVKKGQSLQKFTFG